MGRHLKSEKVIPDTGPKTPLTGDRKTHIPDLAPETPTQGEKPHLPADPSITSSHEIGEEGLYRRL